MEIRFALQSATVVSLCGQWQTGNVRWQNGHNRVLRGGNWINDPRNLRSANRNANEPDNRNRNIGFRLAEALPIGTMAGRSVNQLSGELCSHNCCKKPQGPGRVSRHRVDARTAESLPRRRLFCLTTAERTRVRA